MGSAGVILALVSASAAAQDSADVALENFLAEHNPADPADIAANSASSGSVDAAVTADGGVTSVAAKPN